MCGAPTPRGTGFPGEIKGKVGGVGEGWGVMKGHMVDKRGGEVYMGKSAKGRGERKLCGAGGQGVCGKGVGKDEEFGSVGEVYHKTKGVPCPGGGRWWGREYFRFRAAGFGFRRSAEVASRVSKELLGVLRRKGHRGLVWVDDFLLCFESREAAEKGMKEVVELLERLGFVVGQKSILTPTQRLEFLGLIIDSRVMKMFVPDGKVGIVE